MADFNDNDENPSNGDNVPSDVSAPATPPEQPLPVAESSQEIKSVLQGDITVGSPTGTLGMPSGGAPVAPEDSEMTNAASKSKQPQQQQLNYSVSDPPSPSQKDPPEEKNSQQHFRHSIVGYVQNNHSSKRWDGGQSNMVNK
jgi:hypothetical protein